VLLAVTVYWVLLRVATGGGHRVSNSMVPSRGSPWLCTGYLEFRYSGYGIVMKYRRELVTLIPQVHWTFFYCEIAKVLGTMWWLKV
jgi:hypothetical protein